MSSPTTGGEDDPEDFEAELDERAKEVLEDGEFVTFAQHNDDRD